MSFLPIYFLQILYCIIFLNFKEISTFPKFMIYLFGLVIIILTTKKFNFIYTNVFFLSFMALEFYVMLRKISTLWLTHIFF